MSSLVATSERIWSAQQEAIFGWFENSLVPPGTFSQNLVVRARAGTGKTTTILEAILHAPEAKILLCAFNKRIAEELTARLSATGSNAVAKTLHSVGFGLVSSDWSASCTRRVERLFRMRARLAT
jgi:superfamily I DNA/RNA helicase